MDKEQLKKKVAEKAAEEIKDGQLIGIGSGTTVNYLIEALIRKKKLRQAEKKNFQLKLVAASKASENKLKKGGFQLADFAQIKTFDLVLDGADFVDSDKNLVKGYGGALLREKLIMREAKRILIMIDEAKLVKQLENFKLPIEIVAFGADKTRKKLEFASTLRKIDNSSETFITDNHNLICDLNINKRIDPIETAKKLKLVSGVVETGLFVNFHPEILVAKKKGTVEFLT